MGHDTETGDLLGQWHTATPRRRPRERVVHTLTRSTQSCVRVRVPAPPGKR